MILKTEKEIELPDAVIKHIQYAIRHRLEAMTIKYGPMNVIFSYWNSEYMLEICAGNKDLYYTFKDQTIFEEIMECNFLSIVKHQDSIPDITPS